MELVGLIVGTINLNLDKLMILAVFDVKNISAVFYLSQPDVLSSGIGQFFHDMTHTLTHTYRHHTIHTIHSEKLKKDQNHFSEMQNEGVSCFPII